MPKFKITTPIAGWSGIGPAGTPFSNGEATIDTTAPAGLSLLVYARGAGYGIEPLEDVSAEDAINNATADPVAESVVLKGEIEALELARDVSKLRKQRDDLRREVYGENADTAEADSTTPAAQQGEGSTLTPGADTDPQTTGVDKLIAPPAESAPVAEWRSWVVESGRGTPDDVEKTPRAEIISKYGSEYDQDRAEQLKGGASA